MSRPYVPGFPISRLGITSCIVFLFAVAGNLSLPGLGAAATGVVVSSTVATRAAAVSAGPMLDPIADMKVKVGSSADQELHARDADSDPLTFSKASGPACMVVTTIDPGAGSAIGNVRLTPTPDEIGSTRGRVVVTDGVYFAQDEFYIVIGNNPPAFYPPSYLSLYEGSTRDEVLRAVDIDGDPLTFALVDGPGFITVTTTGENTGNLHLAPGYTDSGQYTVAVSVTDGLATVVGRPISLLVGERNLPATLIQPADMSVTAGATADQTISATDPDSDPLTFYMVQGPAYMTVDTVDPGHGTATGNIHLAPLPGDGPTPDAGATTVPATVGIQDGTLTDRKSFSITVWFPADNPPVLSQPADMAVAEESYEVQGVGASDPDGDWVSFSKASGPAFMSVWDSYDGPPYGGSRVVAHGGSGVVALFPTLLDAGGYTATLRATDSRGLADEASFHITVTETNAPPMLEKPGDMVVFLGKGAEQEIHANDIDGSALTFSKAAGPSYMSVSTTDPGTGLATGIIQVTPSSSGDPGVDSAAIRVSDGLLHAVRMFRIETHPVGAPVLLGIGNQCLHPATQLSMLIAAIDPEGDPLVFSSTGVPAYGSFTDHGDGTAVLVLAPSQAQAFGPTSITVNVSDGTYADSETFTVSVLPLGQCPRYSDCCFASSEEIYKPVASAGGPYVGMAEIPALFDGRASSDAKNKPLSFSWLFGDGASATGPTPSHAYAQGGAYTVILTVDNGIATARATATVTIAGGFAARAFTAEGHAKIRLDTGKPTLCAQIEPVGGSYRNEDVDPSTIVMKSPGTGSVDEIPAVVGKTHSLGDRDENGVEEIGACFRKEDLQLLFGGITGKANVTVHVEGRLVSGGKFRAPLDLLVVGSRGSAAVVSPNPLNPEAVLSFATQRSGHVRVSVFDLSGRLVRVLFDDPASAAGPHVLRVDGRGQYGERLASGVYYYRVETPGAVTTGRFVIMR